MFYYYYYKCATINLNDYQEKQLIKITSNKEIEAESKIKWIIYHEALIIIYKLTFFFLSYPL